MEAVSFGVGIVGLAGLFSACIDCFDLVQNGRYLGKDYLLLETKFANQRLRFVTWGRACGLTNLEGYDITCEPEALKSQIQDTLIHLLTLFRDGTTLKKRYGLREDVQTVLAPSTSLGSVVAATAWNGGSLGQKLQEFRQRIQKTRKQATLGSSARWAIEDRKKFTELVQHLKDLIDDLEGLTRFLGVAERQRVMIEDEMESISEISMLESMEEARLGNTDAVSSAASLRLWKVRDQRLLGQQTNSAVGPDQADTSHPGPTEEEWDMLSDASKQPSILGEAGHYQVLYKVQCNNAITPRIFLDAPNYLGGQHDVDQWQVLDQKYPTSNHEGHHISGRRRIPSLEDYLRQNNSLNFVVFNHYECCNSAVHKIDPRPLPTGQSVRLLSKDLCYALARLFRYLTSRSTYPDLDVVTELRSPYVWFYWAREEIQIALSFHDEEDFNLLPDLFETMDDFMATEYAVVDDLLDLKVINWKYMGYIYVGLFSLSLSKSQSLLSISFSSNTGHKFPGEILFVPASQTRGSQERAYKQTSWPNFLDVESQTPTMELNVQCWEFHGHLQSVQTTKKISMNDFCGLEDQELAICSLPIFPLRHAEDRARLILMERGLHMWELRNGGSFESGFSTNLQDQLVSVTKNCSILY